MVVLIVLIMAIAGVMRAKYKSHRTADSQIESAETGQLREEVRKLKDRVAVLERIATDKNHLLEQEFERLRDS
ncbi:hypothetical protein [Sphingosinicella sp. CPCC 101087]|uniref:hypothetical protein n=1 Tax=Sphingosinicella sp. CPCC 101087 TaxID=2497754 RepID=UPI00101C81D8|nr:hypothetical protein [Sphingosinicella sp. CPCC 101087]